MAETIHSGAGSAGKTRSGGAAENAKANAAKKNKNKKKAGKFRLSDYEIVLPKGKSVRLFFKCLIAVAALAAAATLAMSGADLRPSEILDGFRDKYAFTHATGNGFPVEIHGTRIIRTLGVTNGTAVLTDTTFTVYDRGGREVVSSGHNLASPSMECSGRYSLLFDRLGKEYFLRGIAGKKCSGEAEDSIICGDVSASGRFALVTTSEIYNARMAVYSPDGKVLHKWKSVDNKLSDIAISPSGKYVAVCGVSTKSGTLVTSVIIQQVGVKKNLREVTFDEALILDIRFDGNSRLALIGDDFAGYLDMEGNGEVRYPFNGRTLNCFDLNDNGDMALVFSGNSDGRNSSVVVINDKCEELAVIETSMTSPRVDLDGERISLLNNTDVVSYHYNGKLLSQAEVSADCQDIFSSQGRLLAKSVMYLAEVKDN